jgi:hypothetical protein
MFYHIKLFYKWVEIWGGKKKFAVFIVK